MQHILIVFATREGQTAKIAGVIRTHLQEAGHKVTLVNAVDKKQLDTVDVSQFDKVVLGASLHIGHIEKELVRFVDKHKAELAGMPRYFFLVLMSAANSNPDRREIQLSEARRDVKKQLPVPFDHIEMIAGALKYTLYGWFVRWIMKRIAKQEGGSTDTKHDHEYTDWGQVKQFAERIAG